MRIVDARELLKDLDKIVKVCEGTTDLLFIEDEMIGGFADDGHVEGTMENIRVIAQATQKFLKKAISNDRET